MLVRFKYQVFHDEKSGYSVCQYKDMELGGKVTIVGNNLPTIKEITYDMFCEDQYSAKYGKTYRALSWAEHINKTQDDIVAYLSCGLFAGISKKTAEKIYETFREATIQVLDEDIDSLIEVPGIGKKTLEKIKNSYIEKRANREIAEILLPYGFSINAINRIYRTHKSDALRIIKEEPYELCNIRGVTFPMADLVAKKRFFNDTSYDRIKAASKYVLTEDMLSGNVCMPKYDFGIKLIKALNTPKITKANVLDYVLMMIKDGTIKYNKRVSPKGKEEYFYYPATYKAERNIAAKIKALLTKKKVNVPDIDGLIDKYAGSIQLDDTQREAVKMGVSEPIYIITGGPGTGKTTILKIIARKLAKDAGNVTFGAKVRVGYFDQEHHDLDTSKTIFEEMSDSFPDMNNTRIRNVLAAFLFTGEDVFKKIGDLSGGQRFNLWAVKNTDLWYNNVVPEWRNWYTRST